MEEASAPSVEEGLMAALQQELLAIPGIAGAEIDDEQEIAGVRVQLAEGADAASVEEAVRRVLRRHGMRPTPGADEPEPGGPPPPPGAPGSVVAFPLVGAHAEEMLAGVVSQAHHPVSVAVEETATQIHVEVRSAGGARTARTITVGEKVDEAVVSAVGELAGHYDVALLGVAAASFGEHQVVTVLLRVGELETSGSAMQSGGRPFAVVQAAWRALEAIT
jgi:hypothetical protein